MYIRVWYDSFCKQNYPSEEECFANQKESDVGFQRFFPFTSH